MSRAPLVALIAGETVSVTGTAMTVLALPWFVLTATGSGAGTGLVVAAEAVGLVLSALLSAPLTDRFGARRMGMCSELAAAVVIAAVPVTHALGVLPYPLLVVLALALGLTRQPGVTGRSVLLPELAGRANVPVERAFGLLEGFSRSARMLGAPLAGALIVLLGSAPVLYLDAVSFACCSALLAFGVPASAPRPAAAQRHYLAELREGLAVLRADRLLWVAIGTLAVTNGLDSALSGVLLPVYARQPGYGAGILGWLVGCFGAGAVAGSLLFAALGSRWRRFPVLACGYLLAGAPRFLLLTLHPPVAVLLAGFVLSGIAAGTLNPLLVPVLFERTPESMRGRMLGIADAGVMAAIPLSTLLAGVLVDGAGLGAALGIGGAVYLAVTLSPLIAPVWRQVERPAQAQVG